MPRYTATLHQSRMLMVFSDYSVMGVFKIVIMLLISFAGFGALAGRTKVEVPNNFVNAFEGSRNDMFGIASCIYNVSPLLPSDLFQ